MDNETCEHGKQGGCSECLKINMEETKRKCEELKDSEQTKPLQYDFYNALYNLEKMMQYYNSQSEDKEASDG